MTDLNKNLKIKWHGMEWFYVHAFLDKITVWTLIKVCLRLVYIMDDKLHVAKQYYIHQDVENWFKQSLNESCGTAALTYHYQYHFNIDYVRIIKISGVEEIIKDAVEMIEKMALQTQYKTPWINKNLYYVRNKEQTESTMAQLKAKHISNYKICNSDEFTEPWFQRKDLEVFTFEALSNTKRRLVERIFLRMAESFEEPIVSICKVLPFHEASRPPTKMASHVLTQLNGAYLKYLSFEDILSLELANKDHRSPQFDASLDQHIQTHLKRQITFRDVTSILNEFKLPATLSYFIYKYRDYIKSCIAIPPILSKNDIRTMSQLFGIQIWNDKVSLTKKATPNNQNKIPLDLITRYLSPVNGYHIFHNFNVDKNHDTEILNTIVLRTRIKGTSTVLNTIFTNLYNLLNSQNQLKVDLHLIGIDMNHLNEDSLSHFTAFHNIIFQEMLLDMAMVSRLLQNMSAKISCFNCQIQCDNKILDFDDNPTQVTGIMFKHMNFKVKQLIMILSKCALTTPVLLDDCNIIPSIKLVEIGCTRINLSYIEFKNMKLTSDLLNVLKHFGPDFIICFNECGITNIDIRNIYVIAKISANRIKIFGEHYVNEMIVLELYTEYHKKNCVFDVNERDFDIPTEILPQIGLISSKFNSINIKLRTERINDHTVKIDMVNNGVVVDLFHEQNRFAEIEVECEVNYY